MKKAMHIFPLLIVLSMLHSTNSSLKTAMSQILSQTCREVVANI